MEAIYIWYLLHCREREEQKTLDFCRECFSQEALQDIFLLTYDCMRRYQGAWHVEKKLLFPSYVLLESMNETALECELRKHSEAAGGRQDIREITLEEENFLRYLCGKEKHMVMSRGVIRGGVTIVTEGPLKGVEAQICRIDRHKRMARLETPEGGSIRYVPAGLEIMEKDL